MLLAGEHSEREYYTPLVAAYQPREEIWKMWGRTQEDFLGDCKSLYYYIFLILTQGHTYDFQKREGREKEKDRNIDPLLPIHSPMRDQTCNLGVCYDWESNLRPFSLWDDTQPTEPHRPGHKDLYSYSP